MVKLPLTFDINEWFVGISFILLLFLFIKVPKTMPYSMILTILLYFSLLGFTADILIGVDYPFNFYKIMDTPKLELFDVIIYGINYSIYGYFYSYLLYKCKKQRQMLLLLLFWIGQSTIIEWFSVQVNVFTYQNGWNTGYSAISYFVVYSISTVVIKYIFHCWEE